MSWINKLLGKREEPVIKTKDPKPIDEPHVEVVKITIPNPKDPTSGYFELDWNDAFVKQLREAGYSGRKDEDVVDQWFNDLCRGVVSDDEF
jgi:hypothetical protein